MAYGDKYQMTWASATADCRLRIQQDGYSSGVTTLTPAPEPFEVTWGQESEEDLTLPITVSTALLRFKGDTQGTAVQEIFDGGDAEWRVLFERDTGGGFTEAWRGFLATDLWRDNPDVDADTVELEAIDGIALLETADFDPSSQDNLYAYARSILQGLHGLPVSANMEWYPYRDGNQLPASQIPLATLEAATNAFDELEPIEGSEDFETTGTRSRRRVLEAILERFGMELFQVQGEWTMRQRSQIQSDGTIKTWPDQTAVTNGAPTTRDLSRSLPAKYRQARPRSLVQRLRQAKSVHTYSQLAELIKNGSFEANNGSLDGWSGGATVKDYGNVTNVGSPTQEDTYVAEIPSDASIRQDVPAILHDAGPSAALDLSWDFVQSENSTPTQFWAETRIALDDTWYIQARNPTVASNTTVASDGVLPLSSALPGTSGTLLIPAGAQLPVYGFEGNPAKTRITLTQPARAGDDVLHAEIPSNINADDYLIYWVWSDTQTSETEGVDDSGSTLNYWGLFSETLDYPGGIDGTLLKRQQIRIPMNAPDGTNLAEKDLSFTVEMRTGATGWLDHVSAQLLINDQPVEQTAYTSLDDQSGRNITITQLLGDGPTASHPRGLQLSGVDVTQDWKVGAYSGGPRSGKLLEQVTAENAMRQQRSTLERRTRELGLRAGDEVWPQDVFTIGGAQYTVSYLRRVFAADERAEVELTRLTDAGTTGLTQSFSMELTDPTASASRVTGGGGSGTTTGANIDVVTVDASGGNTTTTLPSVAADVLIVRRTDATTNTATLDHANDIITPLGATATLPIAAQESLVFVPNEDNTQWRQTGPQPALAALLTDDTTHTRASSAPSGPELGDLWTDTSVSPRVLKWYDGSAWQTLTDSEKIIGEAVRHVDRLLIDDGSGTGVEMTVPAAGTLNVEKQGATGKADIAVGTVAVDDGNATGALLDANQDELVINQQDGGGRGDLLARDLHAERTVTVDDGSGSGVDLTATPDELIIATQDGTGDAVLHPDGLLLKSGITTPITEISDDTTLADLSSTALVTENAVGNYVNQNFMQSWTPAADTAVNTVADGGKIEDGETLLVQGGTNVTTEYDEANQTLTIDASDAGITTLSTNTSNVLSVSTSGSTGTVDHDTPPAAGQNVSFDTTGLTIIDALSTDAYGHVTNAETRTLSIGPGDLQAGTYAIDISGDADTLDGFESGAFMQDFTVSANTGTADAMTDGDTLQIVGGTNVTTDVASSTGQTTITIDASDSSGVTSLSTNTSAVLSTSVSGSTGTIDHLQPPASGQNVSIDTTGFTIVDQINTDAYGHVENVGTRTFATTGIDTSLATGTAGANQTLAKWNSDGDLVGSGISAGAVIESFSVGADSGTTDAMADGDTLLLQGGTNVTTTVSSGVGQTTVTIDASASALTGMDTNTPAVLSTSTSGSNGVVDHDQPPLAGQNVSFDTTGLTIIDALSTDAYGHVTNAETRTITLSDSDLPSQVTYSDLDETITGNWVFDSGIQVVSSNYAQFRLREEDATYYPWLSAQNGQFRIEKRKVSDNNFIGVPLRVDMTSGNVGIGTDPSYALDVNGTINATSWNLNIQGLKNVPSLPANKSALVYDPGAAGGNGAVVWTDQSVPVDGTDIVYNANDELDIGTSAALLRTLNSSWSGSHGSDGSIPAWASDGIQVTDKNGTTRIIYGKDPTV